MGSEAKPGKAVKNWVQRHLNVGFVVGFLLVVITYLFVSQQLTVSAPIVVTKSAPRIAEKEATSEGEKREQEDTPGAQFLKEDAAENGKVVCYTDGPFSDTCDVDGDVRTNGTAITVTASGSERREWKILPYPRRTLSGIPEVTVARLSSPQEQPPCTVTHGVPAVVFALGGLTGNYWHDFSDVLVPLFAASRRYGGEVQFMVSNMQPWWLRRYEAIVRRLSSHDAVDLDRDAEVRCFAHATVGLRKHKELNLSPEPSSGGAGALTMADFTRFLRETYALPRGAPETSPAKRPRMVVIHRGHYRKIVNVGDVVSAAEAAGFVVVVMEPRQDAAVEETAREVNSFDAMLGVHGEGLTNAVFLPAGGVVVQVVPYGKLEAMARKDIGEPAAAMGLRYVEYSAAVEESTLLQMLGPEHPVVKDPAAVHRSGWDKVAEYYLGKQDVRIDVKRFAPTLAVAFGHLRRNQQ